MSFKVYSSKFGDLETVVLSNHSTGEKAEIALTGATLLSFNIPFGDSHFNIIDGFADNAEFKAARGARSWIMIPFANRIPEGRYTFGGKEYLLRPVEPRTQVIHGFASYMNYKLISADESSNGAKVVLGLNEIRPGFAEGYPFALDIFISFSLKENELTLEVSAENVGDEPAPFGTGWHPYFKTNDKGIDDLILSLNADKIIRIDDSYIPLPGNNAYADVSGFPELNFNDYEAPGNRIINGRKLDTCYSSLKKDENGFSECSLTDRSNGLRISMFQRGGVTLAFSGDSLSHRKRMSVALEPMQFITNAFNKPECQNDLSVMPGGKSVFTFGVKADLP